MSQVRHIRMETIANAKQLAPAAKNIRIAKSHTLTYRNIHFVLFRKFDRATNWYPHKPPLAPCMTCGIRSKKKILFVTQPKLALIHFHLIFTPNATHPIDGIAINPIGLCSWGLRTIVWHYFKVLALREGARTHKYICGYTQMQHYVIYPHASINLLSYCRSGHLICSHYLHLVELLCRSINILAAIKSRAQKCRCQLSKIVPRI